MTMVMAWNLATVLIIVFLVGLTWVFYDGYKHERMEKRRCKCPKNPDGTGGVCGAYTIRHCVMIPDDTKKVSRWGKHYRWFVLDECIPLCKDHNVHVRLIRQGAKFFNLWKLAWRHVHDPKQFGQNERLLYLAGIIPDMVPSTSERVQNESIEAHRRAGIIKARLDKPPSENASISLGVNFVGDRSTLVLRLPQTQKQKPLKVWVTASPLRSNPMNGHKLPRN